MFNELKLFWKNIFNYSGRTRRRELWIPNLWNCAIMYVLMGIGFAGIFSCVNFATGDFDFRPVPAIIGGIFMFLAIVFSIAVFLGQISAGVRRCHDIGYPGYVYALCLLGSFVFAVGGIVWIVICCIDSKEDNQWGPNPKQAEPDKYPTSGSIIAAIVGFVVGLISYIALVFAAMLPAMFAGVREVSNELDHVGDSEYTTEDSDDQNGDDALDDLINSLTEDAETEEETAEEVTEETTTEETQTDVVTPSADSSDGKYYEPNTTTDAFVVNIGNMKLNLDFDGGCTVYDYDGSVRVYREYEDGTYSDITYDDSYVEVGKQDELYSYTASNEPMDGYTIENYEERKVMDSTGDIIVTYVSYKAEDGSSVLLQGDIWQNIGSDQYLHVSFMTNATNDLQNMVDACVVTLN